MAREQERGLLLPEQVPPDRRVHVAGFYRATTMYGSIFNPRSGHHEIARANATEPARALSIVEVREVYENNADGGKHVLWRNEKSGPY
jgi:hypothetical protein